MDIYLAWKVSVKSRRCIHLYKLWVSRCKGDRKMSVTSKEEMKWSSVVIKKRATSRRPCHRAVGQFMMRGADTLTGSLHSYNVLIACVSLTERVHISVRGAIIFSYP